MTDRLAAFRLNKAERDNTGWDKVTQYASARMEALRGVTENPRKSEVERLDAATRIDELKQLLRLAQPARERPDD